MRTSEAVSPMSGLVYPMITFTILYMILAFLVTWLMVRQISVLHESYKPELQEA
jgi:cytochrome d ubiquinol oxidase subunit I